MQSFAKQRVEDCCEPSCFFLLRSTPPYIKAISAFIAILIDGLVLPSSSFFISSRLGLRLRARERERERWPMRRFIASSSGDGGGVFSRGRGQISSSPVGKGVFYLLESALATVLCVCVCFYFLRLRHTREREVLIIFTTGIFYLLCARVVVFVVASLARSLAWRNKHSLSLSVSP